MPLKVTIPERVRTGFSFGDRSANSTYKRIERVLTSSTPPGGWRAFVLENISIPISLISGLLLCLSACAYTRNLSTHLLVCPDWASDCQIRPYITWNASNMALVQGLVTVTYSVGLILMICSVRKTAESAIWPILTRHPLSFDQIEAYLSVTRGQVFAPRPALYMLRWNHAATFLLLTLSTFITSLAVAPLIGFAFELSDIPRQFETQYQIGSGTDQIFSQTNPPSSMDIDAMIEYQSWNKRYTQEPMPEYWDWIVDRTILKNFHSIQAFVIRINVNIECNGHELEDYEVLAPGRVKFSTTLDRKRSGQRQTNGDSRDGVEVGIPQFHPALTVWVDDYRFMDTNTTRASLVFATFNGTIERGSQSKISGTLLPESITVSAVMCTIRVELRDELLQVGSSNQTQTQTQTQQAIPTLSSTRYVSSPSQNTTNSTDASNPTPNQNLNNLALWLAVAPVLVVPSINGLQPTYIQSPNNILTTPSPSDSTNSLATAPKHWPLTTLTSVIHHSLSASTITSSRHSPHDPPHPIPLTITSLTHKLNPNRVVYLLIPIAAVLAAGSILTSLTIHLHRQHEIPVMRLASTAEVLKSSMTRGLRSVIAQDARSEEEVSGLGGVKVMFGFTRGVGGDAHGYGYSVSGDDNGNEIRNADWNEETEVVAGLSFTNEIEPFESGTDLAMRRLLSGRRDAELEIEVELEEI